MTGGLGGSTQSAPWTKSGRTAASTSRADPQPTWVDSHCHLDFLEEGPDAGMAAATEAGVDRVVTVGVDLESSARSVALAERLPGVWATVGVHPNDSSGYSAGHERELTRLADHPKVVGIGEAGFDHYRKRASPDHQERSFRSQIGLATRLGLALVVHTRDAHDDTKRVLRDEGPPDRLVMHCFSGDEDDADEYLELGALLSFSGTVTFTNAADVQRAARRCPLDRLLLETDSPFLSPHPYRGRPNSPARIPLIGRFVADLKAVGEDVLVEAVAANAVRTWGGRPRGKTWGGMGG